MSGDASSTRRQTLKAVGGLAGLTGVSIIGSATAAGSVENAVSEGVLGQWGQFQNTSQRTGYVPDVDIPLDELSPKWRYLRGMTPPVYADGRIYIGDFLGILHALDANTGEPLWEYQPGDAWFLASVPAVTEETLVLGGVDGHLHAVNVTDGTRKWREEIPVRVDEEFPGLIPSNPTVYDSTVYIFGGFDVFAYDLDDGTLLWDEAGAADGWGDPAVTEDTVYSISQPETDAFLNVLDRANGLTRERIQLAGPVWGNTPSVVGDTVYVGTRTGNVQAIQDGTID